MLPFLFVFRHVTNNIFYVYIVNPNIDEHFLLNNPNIEVNPMNTQQVLDNTDELKANFEQN